MYYVRKNASHDSKKRPVDLINSAATTNLDIEIGPSGYIIEMRL